MITSIIVSLISILGMTVLSIFYPKMKIGKFYLSTFYLAPLLGAAILLLTKTVDGKAVFASMIKSQDEINPFYILLLFLSMTFLSIVLDEGGFFERLANQAARKAKSKQIVLFIIFYLLVSLLTIFTSNDIIVLTMTPFLIYFAKRSKISPIPYLISEFVAANTWSMILLIGNPTNIYLSLSANISFFSYFKVMWLPTILAGVLSFSLLYLIFRRSLKDPIINENEEKPMDKVIVYPALLVLVICIILMAISNFIHLSMWLISLVSALVLLVYLLIIGIFKKETYHHLFLAVKRLPYSFIPFLLSMFVLVYSLSAYSITDKIGQFLNDFNPIYSYGIASFLISNLINNIPMSVLMSEVTLTLSGNAYLEAVYASIIGSNVGAFFTPIGALAGLMWMNLLKDNEVKFNFWNFVSYGSIIAILTLIVALFGLQLMFV